MMSDVSFSKPQGITLVFNGAEARLQIVAGGSEEDLIFAQEWFTPRQGMQVLTPALVDALARMGKVLGDISRIAVVRGPGSFTGLRLVLSTALGLARPLGISMAGIGYLDALATDALVQASGIVWAVTHARRGQVHFQGFSAGNTSGEKGTCGLRQPALPVAICEPLAGTLDEAEAVISRYSGPQTLLGSGVHKNMDWVTDVFPEALVLPERYNHPAPETLLYLANRAEFSQEPVEPLYIRGCDAEENLGTIAAAKGLDPEEARKRLKEMTS